MSAKKRKGGKQSAPTAAAAAPEQSPAEYKMPDSLTTRGIMKRAALRFVLVVVFMYFLRKYTEYEKSGGQGFSFF